MRSAPPSRYSFVFDGNAQALDHVLVNSLALSRVTRMAYARSNADFPESLRGDATRPERLSDHDAAIVYFALPSAPVVTLNGASPLDVEAFTTFTDPGAVAHDDQGAPRSSYPAASTSTRPASTCLTYSARNGYATTTVTRVVRVKDTIPPAITGLRVTPIVSPRRTTSWSTSSRSTRPRTRAAAPRARCRSRATNLTDGAGDGHTEVDWIVTTTATSGCAPNGAVRAGDGSTR